MSSTAALIEALELSIWNTRRDLPALGDYRTILAMSGQMKMLWRQVVSSYPFLTLPGNRNLSFYLYAWSFRIKLYFSAFLEPSKALWLSSDWGDVSRSIRQFQEPSLKDTWYIPFNCSTFMLLGMQMWWLDPQTPHWAWGDLCNRCQAWQNPQKQQPGAGRHRGQSTALDTFYLWTFRKQRNKITFMPLLLWDFIPHTQT